MYMGEKEDLASVRSHTKRPETQDIWPFPGDLVPSSWDPGVLSQPSSGFFHPLGASAQEESKFQDVGDEYEVPSPGPNPGMNGDGGHGDLASKKVGGGTANQDLAGGLTWDSRVGGCKTLQPNQRPFLLVDGTCYDWPSSFSLCVTIYEINLEDLNLCKHMH